MKEELRDLVSVTFACGGGWMTVVFGKSGATASSGVIGLGLQYQVSCEEVNRIQDHKGARKLGKMSDC